MSAPDFTYGDYLQLEQVLAGQAPRSDAHDEMLFIVVHQVSELWMKLALHELGAAREHVKRDELAQASKMLTRVARTQQQLIGGWDVLATMTPDEFSAMRPSLGASSGFQSLQNRLMEAMLGQKDRKALAHQKDAASHARLEQALSEPSLYDEALRLLARRGSTLPPDVLERDWSKTYVPHAAVTDAWEQVYREPQSRWDLYDLAEKLVDLDYRYAQWRFSHLKTVERIIGFKQGTGGSPGVPYLARVLERPFFPELLDVRMRL